MSVSSCFFIHKILPLPRGYIVKACSVVTKRLLLCGNPHIKEWQNKIELLISIYEISRALVFIYGISGCSRCLGMVTRWAYRKEVKCRAATSIGNTDFLSVTDFLHKKGVNQILFGIFLGIFIGNLLKLHKLGYKQLLWSLNLKSITS